MIINCKFPVSPPSLTLPKKLTELTITLTYVVLLEDTCETGFGETSIGGGMVGVASQPERRMEKTITHDRTVAQ